MCIKESVEFGSRGPLKECPFALAIVDNSSIQGPNNKLYISLGKDISEGIAFDGTQLCNITNGHKEEKPWWHLGFVLKL